MTDVYPNVAGWRGTDTSREAAYAVAGKAAIQREKVLSAYRRNPDLTPEEAWTAIGDNGLTLGAVRSRCSELKAKKILEPTGEKRRGSSGVKAEVLRIARPTFE